MMTLINEFIKCFQRTFKDRVMKKNKTKHVKYLQIYKKLLLNLSL